MLTVLFAEEDDEGLCTVLSGGKSREDVLPSLTAESGSPKRECTEAAFTAGLDLLGVLP